MSNEIAERIAALLDSGGVAYTRYEHAPVNTIEEAYARAPHLTANLLKTIAFEIDRRDRIVLAAVACDAQVDYKKLSAILGCNRRELRLIPAARVATELGFEVGGLGPFAVAPAVEVVLDADIMRQPFVRCGAGVRTRTLELAPAELARASHARIAEIAKTASATSDV